MANAAPLQANKFARGSRIGKLELLEVIGEGGMATVWTARNLATQGKVAVKVLAPERLADAEAGSRFRYEAKLGATLNHRNITRVIDLIADTGSMALVMELLRGETLDRYYKRKGALSTREALAIVVPLLSALQHAHERGIIHRDLKPSNIFLHTDADGQITPKLLDFGIAKIEESSVATRAGDALGTPQYMSPEQVRALTLDGRSDLFSIAIVLYEVITGQNPFPGPTSTAYLAQVLEMEIDPDPSIDPRVWIELKRALSKQAYQRHASAKELAAALCTALGETEATLVGSLRAEAPLVSNPPGPNGIAQDDEDELSLQEALPPIDDARGVIQEEVTERHVLESAAPGVPGVPRRRPVFWAINVAAAIVIVIGLLTVRAALSKNVAAPSGSSASTTVTSVAPPSTTAATPQPSDSTGTLELPTNDTPSEPPATSPKSTPTRRPHVVGRPSKPSNVGRTPGF